MLGGDNPTAERTDMPDVIVIGAGMAGVTAARELTDKGLSVIVVEARDRVGGRLWSIRDFCDEPVEAGAEFIHGVGAKTWPQVQALGLTTRACPLMRHTLFNVGGRTRWLPWIVLHPGTWRCFPILGAVRRATPPDRSAREFIEARGYTGRARVLAEMTLTAHLPGSVDEVGLLGLSADGVLHLETGLNHRIVEGYDSLVQRRDADLDVRLGFPIESVCWGDDGVAVRATEEDCSDIEGILDEMAAAVQDGTSLFEIAWAFHRRLPEAAGNAAMAIIVDIIYEMIRVSEQPLYDRYFDPAQELREHRELLRVLRLKGPELARAAMRAHLEDVSIHLTAGLVAEQQTPKT